MSVPERQVVSVRNPNDGEPLEVSLADAATESNQKEIIKQLRAMNSLVPDSYDQILFEYTIDKDNRDDMTKITFRSDGKTIAVIQMTYSSHRLTSVFRQAQ